MTTAKLRTGLFVSYSHKDREWLDKLEIFLKPVLRGEKLTLESMQMLGIMLPQASPQPQCPCPDTSA
jgi:hypothetical protein